MSGYGNHAIICPWTHSMSLKLNVIVVFSIIRKFQIELLQLPEWKQKINRKCLILWQFDTGAFVCAMEWHETWRLFNWYGVHLMRLFTTWDVQYLSVYKRPHKIYFNLNLITASGSSLLLFHPMNIQKFYEPHNSVLHEIFSWQKDTCYSIHKMENRERIHKSSKNMKEYSANYTEIEMKIMLFPANKQHIKTVIE